MEKSFLKQFRECRKDGVAYHEQEGEKFYTCNKYGGMCMSSKCRKERGVKINGEKD